MKDHGMHLDEGVLDRLRTGELPEGERARAAAHVERCPECARALAELEDLADVVGRAYAADRAAGGPEPDWEQLKARVAAEVRAAEPPRAGQPAAKAARRRAWSRWMPQAAAAVVALLVLGVVFRQGVRGPEDAAETPVAAPSPPAAQSTAEARDRADVGQDDARANAPREGAVQTGVGRQEAFRGVPPAAPPPGELEAARAADQMREADEEFAKAQNQAQDTLADAPAAAEALSRAAALDPHDRFALQARAAIATRDALAATRTLALWRDTLAPRDALDDARRRQADALADSLQAFISAAGD